MTDAANALVLFSNFVLIPGLTYGSQLALGALGVTLIFGILRFANFAHGDLMVAIGIGQEASEDCLKPKALSPSYGTPG